MSIPDDSWGRTRMDVDRELAELREQLAAANAATAAAQRREDVADTIIRANAETIADLEDERDKAQGDANRWYAEAEKIRAERDRTQTELEHWEQEIPRSVKLIETLTDQAEQQAATIRALREGIQTEIVIAEDEVRSLCRGMAPNKVEEYVKKSVQANRLCALLASPEQSAAPDPRDQQIATLKRRVWALRPALQLAVKRLNELYPQYEDHHEGGEISRTIAVAEKALSDTAGPSDALLAPPAAAQPDSLPKCCGSWVRGPSDRVPLHHPLCTEAAEPPIESSGPVSDRVRVGDQYLLVEPAAEGGAGEDEYRQPYPNGCLGQWDEGCEGQPVPAYCNVNGCDVESPGMAYKPEPAAGQQQPAEREGRAAEGQ